MSTIVMLRSMLAVTWRSDSQLLKRNQKCRKGEGKLDMWRGEDKIGEERGGKEVRKQRVD